MKDYQSIPVVVKENVSVYDAICTDVSRRCRTLFVVDDESLLSGVISRKDLLGASIGKQELARYQLIL